MRFSQYVIQSITEGKWKTKDDWIVGCCFVNEDQFSDPSDELFIRRDEKDDWYLYFSGFIFLTPIVFRGNYRHEIELDKEEKKFFLEFRKQYFQKVKEDELKAEQDGEVARQKAQDWP